MAGSPPQENEMATSPAAEEGEDGKIYSSRHEHMVFLNKGLPRYTCSGCKQFGGNIGYKCHSCPDFILHKACGAIPDEYVHPFFMRNPLQFRKKTHLRHHCDGCGERIRGFVFESRSAHLKLHPLCMALPATLAYSGHKIHGDMRLVSEKEGKYICSQCNKVNSNWKYRCEATACKLKVDLNCAVVGCHGLSEHGIARVSRPSRGKHILEKLSSSGKSVVKMTAEQAVSGLVEGVASAVMVDVLNGDEDEAAEAEDDAAAETE